MPLTPSQILSANRRLLGGGGGSYTPVFRTSDSDPVGDLLDEEKNPDSPDPSPSILDRVKGGLTDVVSGAGRTLDYGRAAVVSGALELGEALRPLRGAESTASFDDFKANLNSRMGVGDVLERSDVTANLPLNLKRAIGLTGDLALDPLNYLTLGTSTAAKGGLSRVAASQGDEVAQALAKEGADAADNIIAERFAKEQADAAEDLTRWEAQRAAREAADTQLDLFDDVVSEAPVPRPAILDQTAPTVSEILNARSLKAIERTGQGGIGLNLGRLGAPTLVKGATLAPLGKPLVAASAWGKGTELSQTIGRALVPYKASKDAFGKAIADALPGIGHRAAAMVDIAKKDIDNRIAPLLGDSYDSPAADAIRNAMDVGGDVGTGRALLADNPDALKLLDELVAVRDEAYETLIRAGKNPDELMPKDEYLRHVLTDEGAEALGIKKVKHKPGTRSGKTKSRTREGSVAEKMARDGVASYIDDPVRLVRSSAQYAYDVGGNAMMADALEDLAKQVKNLPPGVKPNDIIRRSASEGFHEIAPGRWVSDEIYNDLFNLSKSGTQNMIVRAWDQFSSIVKRQTLFNPIAFGPYFTQNMATGIAMNAVDGARAADYAHLVTLHKASAAAFKEGGRKGYETILRQTLPAADAELVIALRNEGIFGAGSSLYDDIATEAPLSFARTRKQKVTEFGTVHTAKVNNWGEEILRGVNFRAQMRNGATAGEAANLVRKRHLDYSALGRTAFERNRINRFVFFPTWLLRAPTAIVKAYAHTPGALASQAKVEMGTQWYDRERNDYGDLLGARLSGPASFLTGLGHEVGGEPVEMLNPLIQAVLNKDSRHATDILPPLSTVMSRPGATEPVGRVGGIALNDDKRSRYQRSLLGVRTGVDYGEDRAEDEFQKGLEERAADRKARAAAGERDIPEFSPSQLLKMEAVEAGVEDAYSMNSGELARALKAKGYSKRDIERVIEG